MINTKRIRKDFPIFQNSNTNFIYFDNAATSQTPKIVTDKVVDYYTNYNANVHRGIYSISEKATIEYENVRKKVANFINAPSSDCIVFTKGTTESINLISRSWGEKYLNSKHHILLTEMEHHSNIVPWFILKEKINCTIDYMPICKNGTLDINKLDDLLKDETKLLSIVHQSNVLGTINPIKEIITRAHSKGIKVIIDAAQSIPHMPIDVQELDCDFMVFSGHKMCGPTGVGVLYAKSDILNNMNPFLGGGEMINQVSMKQISWNEIPWKFEAGTPNIAQVIGLGASIDYLNKIGYEHILSYCNELKNYLDKNLKNISKITIYSQSSIKGPISCFNIKDVHPFDLAKMLDLNNIAIRAGHLCAQPLMEAFGQKSMNRVSLYFYNTKQEIDLFIKVIEKILSRLSS